MKKWANKILLIGFLTSLAIYAIVFFYTRTVDPFYLLDRPGLMAVCEWLLLYFPAVPVFCLQLLLCRKTRHGFAALPALILAGWALWAAYGCATHDGWDAFGYEVLLEFCAVPAVGYVLAWAVYGGWSHWKGKRSK